MKNQEEKLNLLSRKELSKYRGGGEDEPINRDKQKIKTRGDGRKD